MVWAFESRYVEVRLQAQRFDPCIFNKFNDNSVIIATAAFHVDDGIIVADTDELLDELEKSLLRSLKVKWRSIEEANMNI